MRAALKLFSALALLAGLSACGGGNEPEDLLQPTPTVNCTANPGVCK